jgi:putative transposase
MFVDNGSPWGDASGRHSTRLRVWLFKLGVALIYSTPHHPRSRGKNKRFHRTLSDEVFALRTFQSLETAQYALDAWREIYNFARAARSHRPSPFRPTATGEPASLPGQTPRIRLWRGRDRANRSLFRGLHPIQGPLLESAGSLPGRTRRDQTDTANGCYGVFFASHHIAAIDLIKPKTVGHVPEQLSAFSPE